MPLRLRPRSVLTLVAVAGVAWLAGGCGEKKKERPQPQVAARVDGREITLPQINLVLEQQHSLRPEQIDAASRQVLARLVDQRLLAAQAERLELDRDPRVRERIDAATREILARTYADHLGDKAQPPTAQEIDGYHAAHPERFAQRRIYSLQELAIEADPGQLAALRLQLQAGQSIGEFVEHLKASGIRFVANQAVRATEQLSPQTLQLLSGLRPGQAVLLPASHGALVIALGGSRDEPLTLERSRPLIEQMLLAERRRKLLDTELRALRKAARIEYQGRFAHDAAQAGGEPAAPVPVAAPEPSAHEASR
ncbi:MAG: peptidyl-prolyl cis-trans isomerase, EpsD family [Rubrivivax sp. SCN 71-131]|nr:MAG: peptidyl-prolyl cis-trans isomerase, EpsD family [Rubrivivax sp. SCN 71-131]